MNKSFKQNRKFIFFPLMAVAFVGLGGWMVMLLWNAIIPGLIVGVGKLTFWKAIGLFVLCKILFGGFKGRPSYRNGIDRSFRLKERMKYMSEEEKEKFKAEWKARCGNR